MTFGNGIDCRMKIKPTRSVLTSYFGNRSDCMFSVIALMLFLLHHIIVVNIAPA